MHRHGHVRLGNRVSKPSAIIPLCAQHRSPPLLTDQHQFPCHIFLLCAMIAAVPTIEAMCRSCPQDHASPEHHAPRHPSRGPCSRKPARSLFHRQRIQFRPQHHGRPRAIFRMANNPCSHRHASSRHSQARATAQPASPQSALRAKRVPDLMNIQVKRMRVRIDRVQLLAMKEPERKQPHSEMQRPKLVSDSDPGHKVPG